MRIKLAIVISLIIAAFSSAEDEKPRGYSRYWDQYEKAKAEYERAGWRLLLATELPYAQLVEFEDEKSKSEGRIAELEKALELAMEEIKVIQEDRQKEQDAQEPTRRSANIDNLMVTALNAFAEAQRLVCERHNETGKITERQAEEAKAALASCVAHAEAAIRQATK